MDSLSSPINTNPNKQKLLEISLLLEQAIPKISDDGRVYLKINSTTGRLELTNNVEQSSSLEKIIPFIVKILKQKDPITRPELKRFANRFAQVIDIQLEKDQFYKQMAKSISDTTPQANEEENVGKQRKEKTIRNTQPETRYGKFVRIIKGKIEKLSSRMDALKESALTVEGAQKFSDEEINLLDQYNVYRKAISVLDQLDTKIYDYGTKKGLKAIYSEDTPTDKLPKTWTSRTVKHGEHHVSKTYQQKAASDVNRKKSTIELTLGKQSYLSKYLERKNLSAKALVKAFELDFKKHYNSDDTHARDFIIGLFDDVIGLLTHYVGSGQIGPEEAALNLILYLGDEISDKNEETLEFDRALFKDMVVFKGKKPNLKQYANLPGSDSEEYKALIRDFKSGDWVDIKINEGEAINKKSHTYLNVPPDSMEQVVASLGTIVKEGSFIPAFQQYFEDVVSRKANTETTKP